MLRVLLTVAVVFAFLALLTLPAMAGAQNPPACPTPTPVPTPLMNQIDRFEALCQPHGARLEWDVSSEVGVTHYIITHDAINIADIPANCPGCMGSASYAFDYTTEHPSGRYMLIPDVGAATATLESCPPPTVVGLSVFGAR